MPLGKFRNTSTNSTWSRVGRSGCKAKNLRTQTPPPALSSVPAEGKTRSLLLRKSGGIRARAEPRGTPTFPGSMAPRGRGSRVSSAQGARGTRGSQIRRQPPLTSQGLRVEAPLAGWRSRLLATSRRCRPGMPHGCSQYACAYLLFANRREPL